jgi:hypothetical protein
MLNNINRNTKLAQLSPSLRLVEGRTPPTFSAMSAVLEVSRMEQSHIRKIEASWDL